MQQDRQELSRPLDTARDAAKDFLRPYALSDLWTYKELSKETKFARHPSYSAILGNASDLGGKQYHLERGNVAVIRFAGRECWNVFDLAELMAEIRDEQQGYEAQAFEKPGPQEPSEEEDPRSLARVLAQPEELAPRKKAPAVYRSYNAGWCKNPACGKELGYIEAEGGRDRLYCNDACRVAAYRTKKREKDRAATLQYNAELREYWKLHNIHGEVLLRLQEILLRHGKAAAKAATDAVLVALAAAQEAGSREHFRLIDEIMAGGAAIDFEELRLTDFRIPAGFEAWSLFVSGATLTTLRQLRGYFYEVRQREYQKAQARKRLEALSGQEPPRSTGPV